MRSDTIKVKSFSSPPFKRIGVTETTSAIISSQIHENRPRILAELGKVCESRSGRLTDEQVAAVAGVISHTCRPSEVFTRLSDWLGSHLCEPELARAWMETVAGRECVYIAWFDPESRRDLPKDDLLRVMDISDEESELLGLLHLISDRLQKRSDRRAEGIQARTKEEPWIELGISKAAYYRNLRAAKAGIATSAGDARPSRAESRPWEQLGISRATYFRQKTKKTPEKTEEFDTISNSETPDETRTSLLEREDSSLLSSSLYIGTLESHAESHHPSAPPPVPLTDPIACARARDRGDDHYYFIPTSRDRSRRLSDFQHLGPDLLTDYDDIENGDYPQAGYTGLWDFQSHISFFQADLDLEPPPIELMKRLPTSIARQFAHKALQLGLTWEEPAYWDLENPWTWFVIDRRPNAHDTHAALSPLADRFWRALSRTNGIAASNAKKASRMAPPPVRVEFDAATMHPPCCSAEDWATVSPPLRNRALTIAGDLFLRGVWQQMDCLAIGIIGAERAETRRKMLVELCPQATPAELETAAINCWQIPISDVPQVAEGLNEMVDERIRVETAHLQPEILAQMDWIMAQVWAEEIIPGGVDHHKIRERMAKALIELDATTWQTTSREILKTAVKRVKDPRFERATWADENRSRAVAKREIMTVQATVTR